MNLTLTHTADQLAELRAPQARPAVEHLLDHQAGTVTIGRTADGAPAVVPLWTEHGAVPLGIIGGPGAGASGILDHLWAAESASPVVSPWVAGLDQDLDHYLGPTLDRRACTPDQTRDLLRAAVHIARNRAYPIARDRAAILANWPRPVYQPTAAEPLITLTLTTWELVRLDDDGMRHVEELTLFGRRGGVALRIAYRGHYLTTLGGNLHATLSNSTLIALRDAELGFALGPARATIPTAMPGTGYLIAPHRGTGPRGPVLFRSFAPHRADA
ncbi:hypothetical protein ACFWNL_18285 [Kitasatospora sp. NPDC058397]|uniref:hypothetical protein n=1 Tax=unclassified Kitasatospora TaxID=2633591 RepID=UPI0036483367